MKRNIVLTIITAMFFLGSAGLGIASDVSIHGFLAQGYMQSSDNNFLTAETEKGTFEFNEMGINFVTRPTDNLQLGMQFFARDLGSIGNDEVVVDWVFGDYSWREWLGFRIGLLKSCIGLYSDTRDVDALRTSILLPQSVYDEWFRDATQGTKGISVYGNVPLSAAGLLQYEFQICDVSIPLDGGTARLIEANPAFSGVTDIDPIKVYLGSLKWYTPLDGLMIGTSGFSSRNTYNVTSVTDTPLVYKSALTYWFISAEYIWENLSVSAECLLTEDVRDMYPVGAPGSKLLDNDKEESTSWYFRASYRFFDWMEAGAYYSEKIDNDDASGAANELKEVTLSTRFDVNDYWTIKLEGHKMDGLLNVAPNEDGTSDEDWFLYLAKVSYNF